MPDPLVVVIMSDIFFEADASNPDHWRYYGREAFNAEVAAVRANPEPWMRTVGDVEKKAIENLKGRRVSDAQSLPRPRARITL